MYTIDIYIDTHSKSSQLYIHVITEVSVRLFISVHLSTGFRRLLDHWRVFEMYTSGLFINLSVRQFLST